MSNIKTDILIVGGGIAGCIAAISLIDTHTVTLIDKLAVPKERIGESLAPAAQRILKELQLLESLHAHQEQLYIQNLGMQSYWGSEQVHIIDHLRNPDGLSKSLDRKAFEIFLRKSAVERGVQDIWPAKLQSSSLENNMWNIVTSSETLEEHHIQAKFVIDATGRQSHFARSQGIKRIPIDKLIACWVTLPNTEENKMSTITATKNGWWYSAVIPNNKRVIAFQTDSDLIDRSTFKDLNSFLELSRSNRQIAAILEKNKAEITFHGVVAANSTQLEKVTGLQWAAIGDAAISFDPLSSQGMFNAMASAMQLKELLVMSNIANHPDSIIETQFQKMYTQQIEAIWEQYVYHKNIFYKAEMRWSDHPFWKRRHLSL
ncbi:tryptophan 7-halogenase [uncultured Dokdonia sp.]|uniref:NAD(P)/FAD-dependent oxidoreductase n=1 Tax=uncultured Dokdonia sp. TaxID=575653 RepID=UPI002614E0A4|nr:tryptophan 7-halogenase [uncultured Dokdonia sp.]